jgi:[CysO sulfur-carrier protein]-S-L-cysteine hydrolase
VVIRLPRRLFDELVAHARSELPNESCGILGGSDDEIRSFHPTRNADASPYRYTVDPRDQMEAVFAIEDAGDDVLAIYHSHTRSAAYPSRTDADLVTYPDAAYLILSLASDPPELRAFNLNGAISELELQLVD